jgi:hypothetical protein
MLMSVTWRIEAHGWCYKYFCWRQGVSKNPEALFCYINPNPTYMNKIYIIQVNQK